MDAKVSEKKERLLAALEKGMVMIHLDARRTGVLVPTDLKGEAHLRLNLSYRFDPPDLSVSEWGIRSTLSFSGSRFTVAVPWSALFAITSHATREFWMYPDDLPPELLQLLSKEEAAAPAREEPAPELPPSPARAVLREVVSSEPPAERRPDDEPGEAAEKKRQRGSHLRLVK